MKVIVFLGAPGSGKGTQASKLKSLLGTHHFSTGEMLRTAIQSKNSLGTQAEQFVSRGELVPDNVMIGLIRQALKSLSPNSVVVLDGFPRTVVQAEFLDLQDVSRVSSAVFFSVPQERLIERLTGRRICSKCGETFHLEFRKPIRVGVCDSCGTALSQRADDEENLVRKRLKLFQEQNGALLSYYRHTGRLYEIDGDASMDEVRESLFRILS
jgi:adenylate kinase